MCENKRQTKFRNCQLDFLFKGFNKMVQNPYTVYSITITVGKYYWLRRSKDLNLTLVSVTHIRNEHVTVINENDQLLVVTKFELLEFDPTNRLFKCLMKNTAYRHDQYLKNVLHKLGYNPEVYMIKECEPLVTTDAYIDEDAFYTEYEKYIKTEGPFCDEIKPQMKGIFVSGIPNLSVYALYKKVCLNGGMERITNDQKWKSLFYSEMSKTNVSYTIRTFYKKYLYEFEILRRGTADGIDYQYKFNIKDRIYINVNGVTYYGAVKLRRNCGLNQYYIQFYLWSRENSEWFSEDVLNIYRGNFSPKHHIRRKTRSSKANNLLDDPLTREKHSHFSNKPSKLELKNTDEKDTFLGRREKDYHDKINACALFSLKTDNCQKLTQNNVPANRFIDENTPNNNLEFAASANVLNTNNLCASMGTREKKELKENKKNNILQRTTSKRKQKIIKMLQEMNIIDESGQMTEENYMFLSFFNLK